MNSFNNFIYFECTHESLGIWRYTGYYGFLEQGRSKEAWKMIKELSAASSLPWCMIGDYNDLLSMEEKRRANVIQLYC